MKPFSIFSSRFSILRSSQRRVTLLLAALVLLGLALRLWFVAVNVIDPRFSAADDGDYYQRALRLAVTGEYRDDSWLIRPPLHIFLFAGLLRVSMALWAAPAPGIHLIRATHILLSLLSILMGYDMAQRLFSIRTGLIFAFLLAGWFPFVELPTLILSEPLYLFLLLTHLWMLVRWRDQRTWRWLIAAGVILGLAALARSPALYASAFSAAFVLFESWGEAQGKLRTIIRLTLPRIAVLAICVVVVVGPWTLRNYRLYDRFIPVDTTGPVNLWLALQPQAIDGGKTILASMDQAQRQDFVSAETRSILSADPWLLTRNVWPHFLHIWKAQFAEDFLLKASFFTRPLRAIWSLGAVGDLLWLGFTLTGLVALARPLREGAFRLVALGWMGYALLQVTLVHVEPRYLLPLWLLLALYGSWGLAEWRVRGAWARAPWLHAVGGLALAGTALLLILSYRNYPAMIMSGIVREQQHALGSRAYAQGDYQAAELAFRRSVAAQPIFVDGRADLALTLVALGRPTDALTELGDYHTHRADLVRGAILRELGDTNAAAQLFNNVEVLAGEDVKALALHWLRPAPRTQIVLGDGGDFGYVQGFSPGEQQPLPSGTSFSYRWLQGQGQIVLPLEKPLKQGSVVELQMTGGQAEGTPLTIRIGNAAANQVLVRSGQWRVYRFVVPESQVEQTRLTIYLSAPTFIPAQQDRASDDLRSLSLMVRSVAIAVDTELSLTHAGAANAYNEVPTIE